MDKLHKPTDTFILCQLMLIQHRVMWCGVGPLLSIAFGFCFALWMMMTMMSMMSRMMIVMMVMMIMLVCSFQISNLLYLHLYLYSMGLISCDGICCISIPMLKNKNAATTKFLCNPCNNMSTVALSQPSHGYDFHHWVSWDAQ